MTPTRTVILTTTVSALVFLMAGGKVETLVARARGTDAPADMGRVTSATLAGWAFLFVSLIILADIEQTGELAAAFSWLIFLSIMFAYGPSAFAAVTKAVSGGSTTTP